MMIRFELRPLERAARTANLAQLARRLGISHRHAQRLRQHGLSEVQADRFATRLGEHPDELWDGWNDWMWQ